MALQSKLFKADANLQACLGHDAAHVTPGARGDHVGKIQTALTALGDEVIDAAEIKAKTYGPSTASAVLAYKRKRKIINFSYQTQADNIVGKMTIASLDKEMQKLEQPPLAINSSCPWQQKRLS
jgi:peptidoglycan hydrolase-like protein with peptidoglycan-binding domain